MICSDFTEHEMLAATLNLMANYVMKFLDIVLIVYEYMRLIEQISIDKYATSRKRTYGVYHYKSTIKCPKSHLKKYFIL